MDGSNWFYTESIEVSVPPEAVFTLLTSGERLLQLHPEWGQARLEGFDEHYPHVGGEFVYRPLDSQKPPYTSRVAAYQPNQYFELHSQDTRQTKMAFDLQPSASGTTLTCRLAWELDVLPGDQSAVADQQAGEEAPQEGESPVEGSPEGESPQEVLEAEARFLVHEWLTNLKRYAELGDRWLDRLMKWSMDSLLLRLRADQRRIILMLLVFQLITFITFVAAALGLGLAAMIFKLGS